MEGLFKTPEQVRQSQYEAMMSPNISSAMRRGMMTGGGLARAFGGVTEEEAQAKQTQELMGEVKAGNPDSMLIAAERMREAGNLEGAFKLEEMAQGILGSQAKSAEEKRRWEAEYGVSLGNLQFKLDRLAFDKDKAAKEGEDLGLKNSRTMIGPDGKTVFVGTNKQGQSVMSTVEGLVPVDTSTLTPMPNLTKDVSYSTALNGALSVADPILKPGQDRLKAVEEAKAVLGEAANGNEQATNQLKIIMTKLNADGRFSMAQLEQATGDIALASKVSSFVKGLATGDMTQLKLGDTAAVIQVIEQVLAQQYASDLRRVEAMGGPLEGEAKTAWDAAVKSYTPGSESIYSPDALKYLNE